MDENTYSQLYDTYTEYEIDANGRFDSNLDGIEFKSLKFNHCYDKLEKDHSSDGRSYMAKNEDDLFVIVYPEDKERLGLADYYGIPNRIRSYMVATYGKEVLFESENIKGFQDGMPSEDSSVYLRIFDASGEVEESYYVLIIGGTTQEEVDMILNSVEFGNGMGGEYVFRAE